MFRPMSRCLADGGEPGREHRDGWLMMVMEKKASRLAEMPTLGQSLERYWPGRPGPVIHL